MTRIPGDTVPHEAAQEGLLGTVHAAKFEDHASELEDFAMARFELHFTVILIDLSRPLLAT